MKNRVLFQQDVTLLSKSGMCHPRHYTLAYVQGTKAEATLEEKVQEGFFSFLKEPFVPLSAQEEWPTIQKNFRHVNTIIVVGSPSSLHTLQLLAHMVQSWVWVQGSRPRLCFLDALDSDIFWEVISVANPHTTGLIVLSRWGKNSTTLLYCMRTLEYWKDLVSPELLAQQCLIITGEKPNPLRAIAATFNILCLPYPQEYSRGFGCFSWSMLMPLMLAGFQGETFLAGAAWTCAQFFKKKIRTPLQGAALMGAALRHGISHHTFTGNNSVFRNMTSWMQQIFTNTPISVLPEDLPTTTPRFYTMFFEQNMAKEHIDAKFWKKVPEVRQLSQMLLPQLSLQHHTELCQTHIEKGNFVRTLFVKSINEETLGALMMQHCLEASLLNIWEDLPTVMNT